MSCYHPIQAYLMASSGTPKRKIVFNLNPFCDNTNVRPIELPCGKCIGCKLDYSRQWANRCMLELGYHKSSYFCTFTYDDAHLPKGYSCDPDTGECISPVASLRRRDAQLLLKRIRKRFSGQKIRFFGSGEYGTQTLRPHYHIILFGLELDDLETYKKGEKVGFYYNSPSLSECWPQGFCVVAKVTWDTCAYVARYCLKKHALSGQDAYRRACIEPEFSMCSRRPGIGRQYYDDHPEMFDFAYINLPGESGGKKVPPPRYYKRLLSVDDPDLAIKISDLNMQAFEWQKNLKKGLTDLEYYDMLKVQEEAKQKRIIALRRNMV